MHDRRRIVVLATCFTAIAVPAVALLVGPSRTNASEPPAVTAPGRAPPREVFLRDCATCHGADGRGTELGPDLQPAGAGLVDYYLSTGRMPLPPDEPHAEVRRGTPAYPPAEIAALVEYVTSLTQTTGPPIPSPDPESGDLALGGSLYRAQCAACHAWSGDGGALLHREAPSVHPATAVQIAEAVRGGPGNMPAFGTAALTRHQLDSVVRYVRYLGRPDDPGGAPLWHLGPLAEGATAILLGGGALLLVIRWIGTRT